MLFITLTQAPAVFYVLIDLIYQSSFSLSYKDEKMRVLESFQKCLSTLTACFQLFCQMINWFMFFCITRTLSNSLETVLTTVGIFYWFLAITTSEKSKLDSSRKLALAIAALACAIRPTSAITWFYVGLMDLFQVRSKFKFIFLEVIPVG